MKKALLLGSLLVGASTSFAQLALENFNNGLPSTWKMIKVDGNTPNSGFAAPIPTVLASQAWMNRLTNTGDSSMMTVSWFTSPAKADRWLITPSFMVTDPKMVLSWIDAETIQGGSDSLQIWVSTNGGTNTTDFTTKIYDGPVSPYATTSSGAYIFGSHAASLSNFNGQNIRVAFRNNSTDAGASRIDNVQTTVMANAVDGKAEGVKFPKIVSNTSSNSVVATVSNQGATTITSIQITYAVDGGTPVSQTFTGLSLSPLSSADLTFTNKISSPASGQHTIAINIVQVNGAADPVAGNNTKSTTFASATGSVTRNALIEEYTSSTCVPCANFNVTFDPLILSNNANSGTSNFNIIKYQMNWPSPGNDVSYNNVGLTRRNYYGVNAIPDHYTNGAPGGAGDQAEITASKGASAYVDISNLTYIIKGDSMIANATITPKFTITGNYKVHMAGLEYHYTNNGATTTQKEYYHVMRDMLGGGSGQTVTSWTAGTPVQVRWAHKWAKGTVAQMSTTYWNHPMGDGELVVFVQDESDKTVLQSAATKASWPLGVESLSQTISQASVYPNPAADFTTIAFKLESAANVNMQVVDAVGRVVYTVADQKMAAGTQMMKIPTAAFAAGMYTITVKADGSSINERFSVVK